MYVTRPEWDKEFRCLAGDCPDTCCAGWELPVDQESARRYAAMQGPWGRRLAQAVVEEAGEYQMARTPSGRCVLLNDRGLCDLYAQLGEEALCRTCWLHPRFVAEYGARREIMPGLSCPAWAQLFLLRQEPVRFLTEETAEEVTQYNDLDAGRFFRLYTGRRQAMELLQAPGVPLGTKMEQLLTLGEQLDETIENPNAVPGGVSQAYRKKLLGLEILTPRWKELLETPVSGSFRQDWEPLLEKVLVYDTFRFFLKGVYDGRVLPWVKLSLFHALVLASLVNRCSSKERLCEVIRLYSKEIEHNAENVERLHRAFCRRSGRYGAAGLRKAMEELL